MEPPQSRRNNFTLAIIGCGNLGSSIVQGFVAARLATEDSVIRSIHCVARTQPAVLRLQKELASESNQLQISVSTDVRKAVSSANIVLLAVKSQSLVHLLEDPQFLNALRDDSHTNTTPVNGQMYEKTVLSVVGGLRKSKLAASLHGSGFRGGVICLTTNLAVRVRMGLTIVCADASDDAVSDLAIVNSVFAPLGSVVVVDPQSMTAATVLGACGPAFLAEFTAGMLEAVERAGLDEADSIAILGQALKGVGELLLVQRAHPAELAQAIATKAGCTQAGLDVLRLMDSRGTAGLCVSRAIRRLKGV